MAQDQPAAPNPVHLACHRTALHHPIDLFLAQVRVHFPCPVERVWQTVIDLAHTVWRSDLARVEVLDEPHFVEHTQSGIWTICARNY